MLNAIRSRPGCLAAAATKPPSGAGIVVVTSRNNAASSTDRAIGPLTLSPHQASSCGASGTRSRCGLSPNRPHQPDGMRIEPPPSEPSASGASPAATAAPLPPLLPPGVQRGVPRVAGRPERQRFGEREDHQFRHSGFADDHRARRAQPADHLRVVGRRRRDRAAAAGREFTGDVDVVLDRDRDAQQRQPLAGVEAALRGQGLLARGLGQHHAEAAQLRVQPRDAVQVDLEQRRRGDGGRGQHPRLFGGSREGQIC